MTKAKLNEEVLALCAKHNAPEALTKALNALTEPKKGGAVDVNEYTVFNDEGKVAYILCSTLKVWLPVEFFKEDAESKNGFKRDSALGVNIWTARNRAIKASEKAILMDVLEGVISGQEGKEAILKLKDEKPELEIPVGVEFYTERPEA